MTKRRLSPDGERRFQLALALCERKKEHARTAIETALNASGPYDGLADENHIRHHLPHKLLALLSWEEKKLEEQH